ncbi:hypothetical protein sr11830 [Sporisorium reilianum SRZ2]|uniref:Uncharacterized protein n=1 Tax=Sporisorium reilianum (strain SRZ2) TaxID=999809 RepID=E6ZKW1_SPORE|nr:hypothetical protein sr11830 [Sporisorium reilianum SRZ2]
MSACEHKEWMKQSRVKEWAQLRERGTSVADADCIVYGHLAVFGHPEHDRVRNYTDATPAIRLEFCRPGFNVLQTPASASPPAASSSASLAAGFSSASPPAASSPASSCSASAAAAAAASSSSSSSSSPSSSSSSSSSSSLSSSPSSSSSSSSASSSAASSPVRRPNRQVAASTSRTPSPSPRQTPQPNNRDPSPSERQRQRLQHRPIKRPRSESVVALPRFPPPSETFLSDAEYREQSQQAYKDLFTHYAEHAVSRAFDGAGAREAALTVVVENYLNTMHRLNDVDGGSFTGLFGVGLTKRRRA